MPSQIINMNELVGDDIVFSYGKPPVEYRIPGDIDVETVFGLFEMFATLTKIEGDDPALVSEEVKRRFLAIRDKLMELFRIRDPKLAVYPFGIRGTGIVLKTILGELGINVSEERPTPPSPAKKKAGSRTVPKARARRR